MLREDVLRHVGVWVVLREEHHSAAEPRDRRQRGPPLPHKVSTLRVPQLIAPWIWWVVHVRGRGGVFPLGEDNRVDLVSRAGNKDIMDNGLAEGENIGFRWQDGEYETSSYRSSRLQPRGHPWYK